MFDNSILFCFKLSPDYEARLAEVPESQKNIYIQDKPDFLRYVKIRGENYLAKSICHPVTINDLELIRQHIYSVLKQLIAEYPYEQHPLTIQVTNRPLA